MICKTSMLQARISLLRAKELTLLYPDGEPPRFNDLESLNARHKRLCEIKKEIESLKKELENVQPA